MLNSGDAWIHKHLLRVLLGIRARAGGDEVNAWTRPLAQWRTIIFWCPDCRPEPQTRAVTSREMVQIPTQAKAGASSLECLRFGARTRIVVVRPFLSCGRVRTESKRSSLAGHQHLDYDLRVLRTFTGAVGMHCVLSYPSGRKA